MTETTTTVDDVLGLASRWRRPDDPTLADEYERLFVGPGRVPCPPYESLWRDDVPVRLQGTLLGPCVPDLENCYAALGLQVATTSGELADHIAVELEALSVALADPGYGQVARALLHDHLVKWTPSFCGAVLDEAQSDHYRALAADTARHLLELERVVASDG